MTEHSPTPWIAGYWTLQHTKGERRTHWKFISDENEVTTARQIHYGVAAGEIRWQPHYPGDETQVIGTDGEYSETELHLTDADAKHIVHCVNAHDNLIKSLEGTLEFLDNGHPSERFGNASIREYVSSLLAKARQS